VAREREFDPAQQKAIAEIFARHSGTGGPDDLSTTRRYTNLSPEVIGSAIRLLDSPGGLVRGASGEAGSTEVGNTAR
jgi:hypothetical protein